MINNESLASTINSNTQTNRDGDDTYVISIAASNFNEAGELASIAPEDVFSEADGVLGGVDTVKLRSNAQLAARAGGFNVDLNNPLFANIENLDISETGNAELNVKGNAQNNVLTGNAASNLLDGGAGDDSLDGGAGYDTLIGGDGDDTYVVDGFATGFDEAGKVSSAAMADTFIENEDEGNDTVQLRGNLDFADSLGSITIDMNNPLLANIENLDISQTGSTKLNVIGNLYANILIGNDANNVLDGGVGYDTLRGGAGDDIYVVDAVATQFNEAGKVSSAIFEDVMQEYNGTAGGFDTVVLRGNLDFADNLGNVTIALSRPELANIENIDVSQTGNTKFNLIGNSDNNMLIGNNANNLLDGAGGNDVLIGGAGDDVYVVDGIATAFDETGKVTYAVIDDIFIENADAGNDTVQLRGNLDFADSIGTLVLEMNNPVFANIENLDISLTGNTKLNVMGSNQDNIIIGNNADNTLEGGAGNDVLIGGGGKNTLIGDEGNDTLDSRSSASEDVMIGGAGDDTYIIDMQFPRIGTTEKVDGGYTYLGNVDRFVFKTTDYIVEDQTAAGGNDTLKIVFNGSSQYIYENWINLDFGELLPGIENIDLRGVTGINTDLRVTASDQNNLLISRSDVFSTFYAQAGDDTLLGGDASDRLYGGDGNDILMGGGNSDALFGDLDADYLDGGEGGDLLNGGLGCDYLIGGNGNDRLVAGNELGVIDTLIGGLGDDTYVVDFIINADEASGQILSSRFEDYIVEAEGLAEGFDIALLQFSAPSITFNAVIDMNDSTFANLEGINAAGIEVSADSQFTFLVKNGNNNIVGTKANDQIQGGAGNDSLDGYDGNDQIQGGDGNDFVGGGAGDDQVQGGAGNDNVVGGSGNDTIWGGAGDDDLNVSEPWSFWFSRENDVVYGGDGNDRLYTGNGYDLLFGEDGNDTFISYYDIDPTMSGGAGADTFQWDLLDTRYGIISAPWDQALGRTNITDFSLAEGDKLDLRDCLIREDGDDVTRLLDYLDVRLEGGDTIVTVSSYGQLNNSEISTDYSHDILITLQGVDLYAATGTASESDLLQSLMTSKNLVVDI